MRVDVVGGQTDGIRLTDVAGDVPLSEHEVGDHPPRLADVQLRRPVAGTCELVRTQTPLVGLPLHRGRDRRIGGEVIEQSGFISVVCKPYGLALRIAVGRIALASAKEVRGEAATAIQVCLPIAQRRDGDHSGQRGGPSKVDQGIEAPLKQQEARGVVGRGLEERHPVRRVLGHAQSEGVGLYPVVTRADGAHRLPVHPGRERTAERRSAPAGAPQPETLRICSTPRDRPRTRRRPAP